MLRRLSAPRLASELRPWFAAGYSPADILWALDHLPGGAWHLHTDAVRFPASWLAWRMSRWLDNTSVPVRPHSAEMAEQAEVARDLAARERARLARRPGADPAPYVAQILADLAAQRRSSNPGLPCTT